MTHKHNKKTITLLLLVMTLLCYALIFEDVYLAWGLINVFCFIGGYRSYSLILEQFGDLTD